MNKADFDLFCTRLIHLSVTISQADGTTNALEAIMPEPFAQLHRPRIQVSLCLLK